MSLQSFWKARHRRNYKAPQVVVLHVMVLEGRNVLGDGAPNVRFGGKGAPLCSPAVFPSRVVRVAPLPRRWGDTLCERCRVILLETPTVAQLAWLAVGEA